MKLPEDKRARSPADRFRKILSAEKEEGRAAETRKPPVVNLPRVGSAGDERPPQPPAGPPDSRRAAFAFGGGFLPTFWTIASIASLIANVILTVLVISLLRGSALFGTAGGGSGVVVGLYSSLEQMDLAHLKATIPVHADVPLNTSIPVQATSKITLARDVAIQGARVKISTGPFQIDAPASLTLPAGTSLDVALDLTLPVQTTVPMAVDVPVDIPLQDTDLHPVILGLQESLKPLLCATAPDALSLSGEPVCR